jgi:uncharacterized protein YbaR (Trm112 family)
LRLQNTVALPDHHDFSDRDLAGLEGQTVLCTEKDAVKLFPLAGRPGLNCWPCRWCFLLNLLFLPRSMHCWRRGFLLHYHRSMDTKLLELLVCPVTKGPLDYDREKQELVSRSARLAYPVRDGLPVLLESEARTLTDEELGL